jgi:hypothetical protein
MVHDKHSVRQEVVQRFFAIDYRVILMCFYIGHVCRFEDPEECFTLSVTSNLTQFNPDFTPNLT